MKKIIFLLLVVCAASCVAGQSRIQNFVAGDRCEEAEAQIYQVGVPAKIWGRTKQVIGTVVSVGVAGAGYVQDAFVILIEDVAAPAFVCAVAVPVDFSMFLRHGKTLGAMKTCDQSIERQRQRESAGSVLYERTAELRELDVSAFSRAVRMVAGCYRQRGDEGGKARALRLLNQLRDNQDLFAGLDSNERGLVLRDLQEFDGKPSVGVPFLETPQEPHPARSVALSATDRMFLGSWASNEGLFVSGGTKPELTGKKIAGSVTVRINQSTLEVDTGFIDIQRISFVSDPQKMNTHFSSELGGEKRAASVLYFDADGILELLLLEHSGQSMESIRIVPYYSDGNRIMKIKRRWQKIQNPTK